VPADVRGAVLSTPIAPDGDPAASVDRAMEVAQQFGLGATEARKTVSEVRVAVSKWQSVAKSIGISAREAERMRSAFER